MASELINKYLRSDMMPHIWCPGCGNGIVMHDIIKAIDKNGLDPDKVVIVSGIGCSSRAAGYMNFNTIHTTHGRAIAVATGIKLANPALTVIVITGDGDCSAIGGNHFIHGSRRNIDLTVVVFNNNIYGMTGGQYSPTTPTGDFATTAPYGSIDQPFDVCKLAAAAGASYVARGTTFHTVQTTKMISEGIAHKGFSVIECLTQCPTYYGRKNKKGDAVDMVKYFKENSVMAKAGDLFTAQIPAGKFLVGKLFEQENPGYCEAYSELMKKSQEA